jgi:nucleotide-binding universal stress UspA family protein
MSDFASLHTIHAWDALDETTVRLWSDNQDEVALQYVEGVRLRHQKGLEDLQKRSRAQAGEDAYELLSPRFNLQRGDAIHVIPESARQLHADLVVMGTVARTGISGFFIGNTAEAILEQVQCSVLAIKPPGFISPVKLED